MRKKLSNYRNRKQTRRNSMKRKLRHESLEMRRVLASDLGQIVGVVTNDLAGDGSSTIFAAGQTVELYLDDGDTTFDPVSGGGGDILQTTDTTDANGEYNFDGLVEGEYFVRIVPIAGTQSGSNASVSPLIPFDATEAMGSTNLTIDDFTATQTVSATRAVSDVGTISADGFVDDGSIVGGEQDIRVEVTDGVGDIEAESGFNNGTSIVLTVSSDSGVNGRVLATWDGDDDDGSTVDHGNLALDLTQSGVNSAFALNIAADQTAGTLILRMFSGSTNSSEATFELTGVDTDGIINGSAGEDISIDFSSFTTVLGTGVDFTNVTALQLELDFTGSGENGLDAEVEVLGVVGFTTKTADFTVLNEISLGDQIWLDFDNDGVFDLGETGIQNVAVTLYEDTDGDDDYLDETAIDTALTDASGNYLFTGLLPSDYIVQVDSSNFTGAGVLVGLDSSTGNDTAGMAPDPDTADDNNTDKGTVAADTSVVSKGVTLVGDDEPTDDGDADNNTNLTLDFGFFGYDLVIAKSVDEATAAPDDTLVYTIVVTNDGPSTATDVDFTDTLPTGVTFVSGTTTVGGQSVSGTPGNSTVTSTIGTLLSGQSATITIDVTIDNTTTGVITNTAVTSGTDETDTTNNSATAQTTVSPEIDLVITKTDDDNNLVLSPGDSIAYSLLVENNGPSDATGVAVVDLLPTGLTYNPTGSTTPASTSSVAGGTQLTFNVGDLAMGDTTTILINATVDANFTGMLTNTATVTGNETETDPDNNTSSAMSQVDIEPASISGTVYVDSNDNGVFDSNEQPISGVLITLTGTDVNMNPVSQSTVTDVNGDYSFINLQPGTYQVAESQPAFFPDGQDNATFPGTTVGSDLISTIVLGAGDDAEANNFGELPPTLSKRSFLASNIF